MSALDTQVGGDHYRDGGIQPVQYIEANNLGFLEGCVIKRVTRHDREGGKGRQDIEKAIHELQLLLELRYPKERMAGESQAALSNIEPTPDASRPIVTGCVFLGLPPKGYLTWQDWLGAERKEGVTLMASDPSAPISWSYRNTYRN
jgi:hypothetical protein